MSAQDFLLELRSEEIPARMQAGARRQLRDDLAALLHDAGLPVDAAAIHTFSTPRRLVALVPGLPAATQAVSEEIKGPRANAPAQALEGFLRKTGLTKEQLTERDGVLFAILEKPGRATSEVLAEAIPALIRGFSWPKSQRWGAASLSTESLRWVRPLQGIVALLGGDVVAFAVEGIASGRTTLGHRFHSHGPIEITSAASYQQQLRAHHVIVDHTAREALVREGAAEAAAHAGLTLVDDEGLVVENAGLTEWPVPLLGHFDEAFLEVPPETIQLTARTNQKYFICRDSAGKLANAFICTANIVAVDGGAGIVAGNRKVLAARLSDARFFWQQDRKKHLSDHAAGLSRITFHEKLGTVADKVARVAKLAEWLAAEGIVPGADPALARQAAELCKADLTTEMVGEFPELQGLMGGYYARAEGLPDAVADAIRDHYKPVGQGDDVPSDPVTVCVALADKLDTLVGFFTQGLPPTGSKDPFALRRQALGVISLVLACNIRVALVPLLRWINDAFVFVDFRSKAQPHFQLERYDHYVSDVFDGTNWQRGLMLELTPESVENFDAIIVRHQLTYQEMSANGDNACDVYNSFAWTSPALSKVVFEFLIDRLKVQQREAGVRHDLIDAVFALGGEDDLVRLLARVQALQSFIATPDGANLLAGYKRAANILKAEGKTGWEAEATNPAPEPAEAALIEALSAATPAAEAAIAAEDFAGAMAALSTLRAAVDEFFTSVTVNDADPTKRSARLGLLDRFRAAVHKVADFSRIEG